jgi:hypothetical protein
MLRKIVPILAFFLFPLTLIGQQKQQLTDMTGTVCNSKCVNRSSDRAVCDSGCTEKGGDAVFVEEDGRVTKIANPDKVKGFMGKHVKAKCRMMQDKDEMWFESLSLRG